MYELSPAFFTPFAVALVAGLVVASRQPGGIAGAVARGTRGFALRAIAGLVVFGAVSLYVQASF